MTITSKTSTATLDAHLTTTGATGTATLPDGRPLTFTAPPASGLGGLCDATLTDNVVVGSSSTGAAGE